MGGKGVHRTPQSVRLRAPGKRKQDFPRGAVMSCPGLGRAQGPGAVRCRLCCVSGSSSVSCPVSMAQALSSHGGGWHEEPPCPRLSSPWSAVGQVLPSCGPSAARSCAGRRVGSARTRWSQARSCCLRRERVPHHAGSPRRCTDLLHGL